MIPTPIHVHDAEPTQTHYGPESLHRYDGQAELERNLGPLGELTGWADDPEPLIDLSAPNWMRTLWVWFWDGFALVALAGMLWAGYCALAVSL